MVSGVRRTQGPPQHQRAPPRLPHHDLHIRRVRENFAAQFGKGEGRRRSILDLIAAVEVRYGLVRGAKSNERQSTILHWLMLMDVRGTLNSKTEESVMVEGSILTSQSIHAHGGQAVR